MALELEPYLKKYRESCRAYNFPAIEKHLSPLRKGPAWLKKEDVNLIFHENSTPFTLYWPKPKKDDLDKLAKKRLRLDLKTQDRDANALDREALVKSLLGIFHNTGLVSIILRFVQPDWFGVFSTPVLNVLQVNHSSTVKLYIAYCDELLEWKEHFRGLSSVAEAEMAILMLAETIKGEYGEPEARKAATEFKKDVWVQRRRVSHAVAAFRRTFKESTLDNLDLAKILVDQDPRIAGMIAGFEYERLLGEASWRFRNRKLDDGDDADLLDWLVYERKMSGGDRCDLNKVWHTRNDAVHELVPPTAAEVEFMIDQIKRICCSWERAGAGNGKPGERQPQTIDG